MNNKENKSSVSKVEREDYEFSHYGFVLADFKRENHIFVTEKINSTMDYMNTIFFDLIKDIKPEMREKIKDITKLVAHNISESCRENLDKLVNAQVEKSLSIPDNVILHQDRIKAMNTSEEDLKALEAEVMELNKALNANAYLMNCLTEEWKSYDVQDVINLESTNMNVAKQFLETNLVETEILLNHVKYFNGKT